MSAVEVLYNQAGEDTRRLVDEILRADADDQSWIEQLGPALTGTAVARMLGVSPQAVSSNRGLLRLRMRSGRVGYPVFQFRNRHQIEGLGGVVRELGSVVASPWTTASWLTSPNAELGGDTPVDALREGNRTELVMASARRFAQALSH
ncbi:MAG: DUF2384 domain-containing protein [Microthrixaceae bacterium]|nr:DUF2384 domain-containing protein [Microthrixaceae bacterium]